MEQIESYIAINTGNEIEELSAQHITSCTPNPLECGGSGGCQGSIPQLGFVYTQLFGLQTENDYPYTSGTVSILKRFDSDSQTSPNCNGFCFFWRIVAYRATQNIIDCIKIHFVLELEMQVYKQNFLVFVSTFLPLTHMWYYMLQNIL